MSYFLQLFTFENCKKLETRNWEFKFPLLAALSTGYVTAVYAYAVHV